MSKQREYELTIVIRPDLDEESRNELVESVANMLTEGDGADAKPAIDHWGTRTLAYPIRDYKEAYYVYYEAKMVGSRIRDVEREFNYNDDILRHLFVRKMDKA